MISSGMEFNFLTEKRNTSGSIILCAKFLNEQVRIKWVKSYYEKLCISRTYSDVNVKKIARMNEVSFDIIKHLLPVAFIFRSKREMIIRF